jgi:hypothetical protein
MIYQQIFNKSNMNCATSGSGTAYPSGAPEFVPRLVGFLLFALYNYMSLRFFLPLNHERGNDDQQDLVPTSTLTTDSDICFLR